MTEEEMNKVHKELYPIMLDFAARNREGQVFEFKYPFCNVVVYL